MRVFVLTTGRAASTTFAHACRFIDNMTAAHEGHKGRIQNRLDYPDNHIEVDNRLVWFLGGLERRYSDNETHYVYLTRNHDAVVESYLGRWHLTVSIVRAFYHAILINPEKPSLDTARAACQLFVQTVDDNVSAFLQRRNNWSRVRVEHLESDFIAFLDKAGLQGDREKIRRELMRIKNPTRKKYKRNHWLRKLRNRYSSRYLQH